MIDPQAMLQRASLNRSWTQTKSILTDQADSIDDSCIKPSSVLCSKINFDLSLTNETKDKFLSFLKMFEDDLSFEENCINLHSNITSVITQSGLKIPSNVNYEKLSSPEAKMPLVSDKCKLIKLITSQIGSRKLQKQIERGLFAIEDLLIIYSNVIHIVLF